MNFPLSMTSFGRGEYQDNSRGWIVEIRSVNHRFSDIRIKLPRQFSALEERIKKEVLLAHGRGHVEVTATPASGNRQSKALSVNLDLARQYHDCLKSIREELLLPTSPHELDMVASFPDVISSTEQEQDLDEEWALLGPALSTALSLTTQMREREGATLKKDLLDRLDILTAVKQTIEQRIPELVAARQQTIEERLAKLTGDMEIEPTRLAQEVALIADKADVTEELVRLGSHIDQFRRFLDSREPTGRRLDFLLQEFLREINTMASKISDATIAHQAVELKNEVEKMREQVQNLE